MQLLEIIMSSKETEKRRSRLLVGAGTLSAVLIGTFMAFGGPSAIGAIQAAGSIDAVTTVSDVQSENETLREAVAALQSNETLYKEQVQAANGIIAELQADLNDTVATYDGVLAEYDQSLADLQSQNGDLVGQLQELAGRDAAYSTDLESANLLLTEKGAAIEAMTEREAEFLAAIEQANGSVTVLQNELYSSQQQLVNLNAQYTDLQNLVTVLQARELEYQARINQFNQAVQSNSRSGDGGGYEEHGEYEEEGEEHEEYEEEGEEYAEEEEYVEEEEEEEYDD